MLDERALFDIVFSRALSGRESFPLRLYTADVFGTSHYLTEVEISALASRGGGNMEDRQVIGNRPFNHYSN